MTFAVAMLAVAVLASLVIATVTEAVKAMLALLDAIAIRQGWWDDGRNARPITLRCLAVTQGVILALWLAPAAAWTVGHAPIADDLLWLGGVGLGLTAGETARWIEDVLPRWRSAIHDRVMQVLGGTGNR